MELVCAVPEMINTQGREVPLARSLTGHIPVPAPFWPGRAN